MALVAPVSVLAGTLLGIRLLPDILEAISDALGATRIQAAFRGYRARFETGVGNVMGPRYGPYRPYMAALQTRRSRRLADRLAARGGTFGEFGLVGISPPFNSGGLAPPPSANPFSTLF